MRVIQPFAAPVAKKALGSGLASISQREEAEPDHSGSTCLAALIIALQAEGYLFREETCGNECVDPLIKYRRVRKLHAVLQDVINLAIGQTGAMPTRDFVRLKYSMSPQIIERALGDFSISCLPIQKQIMMVIEIIAQRLGPGLRPFEIQQHRRHLGLSLLAILAAFAADESDGLHAFLHHYEPSPPPCLISPAKSLIFVIANNSSIACNDRKPADHVMLDLIEPQLALEQFLPLFFLDKCLGIIVRQCPIRSHVQFSIRIDLGQINPIVLALEIVDDAADPRRASRTCSSDRNLLNER